MNKSLAEPVPWYWVPRGSILRHDSIILQSSTCTVIALMFLKLWLIFWNSLPILNWGKMAKYKLSIYKGCQTGGCQMGGLVYFLLSTFSSSKDFWGITQPFIFSAGILSWYLEKSPKIRENGKAQITNFQGWPKSGDYCIFLLSTFSSSKHFLRNYPTFQFFSRHPQLIFGDGFTQSMVMN